MRSLTFVILLGFGTAAVFGFTTVLFSTKDRKKRELTKLRYHDCGKSDSRIVKFEKFSAHPMPIVIPGYLNLKINANITRDLPRRLDVRLKLKRKYSKSWMKLPCLNKHYGSCRYKNLESCILTQSVFGCPVRKSYQEIDQQFYIPFHDDDFLSLLTGQYKAVVRARHPQTKEELICLIAHFSLKS